MAPVDATENGAEVELIDTGVAEGIIPEIAPAYEERDPSLPPSYSEPFSTPHHESNINDLYVNSINQRLSVNPL